MYDRIRQLRHAIMDCAYPVQEMFLPFGARVTVTARTMGDEDGASENAEAYVNLCQTEGSCYKGDTYLRGMKVELE